MTNPMGEPHPLGRLARRASQKPSVGARLAQNRRPSGACGMRISAGVAWPYSGSLSAIKLVSTTGSAVTVNLAFHK